MSRRVPHATEFGAASSQDDQEHVARIMRDEGGGELIHSNHAFLCATTHLDRDYEIDDPECEICLATAKVATPNWRDASVKSRRAVCIDTFFDSNIRVPDSAPGRKAWMERALGGLHAKLRVGTPTQRRPAVTEENIRYFQDRRLAREDAECCVWALSFYTGEGSKEASRAGSLCIRQGNMVTVDPAAQEMVQNTGPVLYFLVRALQHLPYWWGSATRYLTLREEDRGLYQPGCDLDTVFQQLQDEGGLKGFQGPEHESHHLFAEGALH